MQILTREKLTRAARLFSNGEGIDRIASKVGVSRKQLSAAIDAHRDLFGDVPKKVASEDALIRKRARDRERDLAVRRAPRPQPAPKVAYMPGLAELSRESVISARNAHEGEVLLTGLTDRKCHWPVRGERAETWFCGETIEIGAVYCACHKARSVAKVQPKGRN